MMTYWLARRPALAFGVSCLLHLGLIASFILGQQWGLTAYASKPPLLTIELVEPEEAPAPAPTPPPPPRKVVPPKPVAPRPLRLPKPIETPLPQMAETESQPPPPVQSSVTSEPPAPSVVSEPTAPEQTGPGPAAATMTGPAPATADANGLPSGPPAAAAAPGPAVAAVPSGGPTGAVTRLARPQGGYQFRPTYPSTARRLGIQGTAVLKVHVLDDGRVGEVVVQQSAGHPDLDQASVDAVRRWRFEPARRGNDPVAVWVLLPVEFRLK
jgi:protein TonB